MNYAIAYLGGILILSLIWWVAGGRKYYTGPLIEAEVMEMDSFRSSESNESKEKMIDEQIGRKRAI